MTEEEIRAKLTLEADEYVKGMERAGKATEDFEKRTKRTGESVGKSMDGMKGKIGELVKATSEGSGKIGTAVTALAKLDLAMGTIGRAKDLAAKIYDVSMSMARLADDAADTEAYMKRTFGSMSGEAKSWAKDMADSYGLYSQEVQSYYTQLFESLTASGLSRRVSQEYAQELTRLKYDLSAVLKWYSGDQISQWLTDVATKGNEEAFQKLMAGQTFEQAAKSAGVWTESMTQAEKKTAMLRLIMAEYSDETGAWADNLDTASGAEERLNNAIEELQKNIGQVLSPVLAGCIEMVSGVVEAFNDLADAIGRITGASVVEVTSADLVREVAASMGQLATATEEASEASAGLAGFDRLNRLGNGSEESGSMDFADGLDAWMRLWDVDALAAETAADQLWDAMLDSGLRTEEDLRSVFGDLFGWMADQSTASLEVKESAVADAWAKAAHYVTNYTKRMSSIGALGKTDEELEASGKAETASRLRRNYGSLIQGIFPELASKLGAYSGSTVKAAAEGTVKELDNSLADVVAAIENIPAYSDVTFRAKVKSWLKSNSTKVETAVDQLPVGSDISDILKAFETAGIDVTEKSAKAMAGALESVSKYSEGQYRTLGEAVSAIGGVEAAVDGIPSYDDSGFRKSMKSWLASNSAKVEAAVDGLPAGSDISAILSAFNAEGIDVSDASAVAAAQSLSVLKATGADQYQTLGEIVTAVGGVETAVGNIPVYDDTQLYVDAQGWIDANWTKISQTVARIPKGSELSTILAAFKADGFDVEDPAVALGIGELATHIDDIPAPQVTVEGDTVSVPTAGIETAMRQAVQGLEVKAQTSVTVQEHDYSEVFQGVGEDVGEGLSSIGEAVAGLDLEVPDYTSLIDQIKNDVSGMRSDLSTVATNSGTKALDDAEQKVEDARNKAIEDVKEAATSHLTSISSLTGRISASIAVITAAFGGQADVADAEAELKALREEMATWDVVEQTMREHGNASDYTVSKYKGWFDQGKAFEDISLYDRQKLATTLGVSQAMWTNALANAASSTWQGTPYAMTAEQAQQEAQEQAQQQFYTSEEELKAATASASTTATTASTSGVSDRYTERYDDLPMSVQQYIDECIDMDIPFDQIDEPYLSMLRQRGITRYATGAVFEPNHPVLGVFGDNRREVEVAAPYSTIVKAVKDALGSSGGAQRIELTANVVLDGRVVAKQTFPYLVQESKRLGASL